MAFAKSVLCLAVICVLGAGVAGAQSVTIVSGNGQLIPAVHEGSPLAVLVRDASGNPLKGVQVTWSVTPAAQGSTSDQTTTTDSTGQTSTNFIAANPGGGASYVQSTVIAKYSTGSAQFIETSVTSPTSGVLDVISTIVTPTLAQLPVSGPAGQQGSVPVKVSIVATAGAQGGHGVPNIAVSVAPQISTNPSTIACAGGTILSDSNGNAVCNL